MLRTASSTGLRSLPARARIGSTPTRWAAHESISTLRLPTHVQTDEEAEDGESERRRRDHVESIMSGGGGRRSTSSWRGTASTPHHQLHSFRPYHATAHPDRGAAIVLGLGAVAATAKAGQYAVRAYDQWKIESAKAAEEEAKARAEAGITDDANAADNEQAEAKAKAKGDDGKAKGEGANGEKRENFFAKFFDLNVGSKYYEGGFDDEMTRREAALILGVRESSTPKRIKEAHRKLLVLNHPDTGGSTYMAGKINEAKELLLKGRK